MLCSDKRIEETAKASMSTSPHVKLVIINLCGDVVVTTTDENKKLKKAIDIIGRQPHSHRKHACLQPLGFLIDSSRRLQYTCDRLYKTHRNNINVYIISSF